MSRWFRVPSPDLPKDRSGGGGLSGMDTTDENDGARIQQVRAR